MKVLAHIREQYSLSLGSYGRPRMTMELKEVGLDVGERRVGRLMRINGIKPVRTRKHKVTTNSNHSLGVAPNLLDGDFIADAPNRKWAKQAKVPAMRNIVGKRSGGGRHQLYLDTRGLALSRGHSRPSQPPCCRLGGQRQDEDPQGGVANDLAIRALDMAANLRKPPKDCIFHSDRGSQYCSYDYQKKLQTYEIKPSMSGKGNCYDNAAVETFFKSLKAELIWRRSWPTRRQTEPAIFQYINGFYNTRRRHLYLGGISPLAFEAKVA